MLRTDSQITSGTAAFWIRAKPLISNWLGPTKTFSDYYAKTTERWIVLDDNYEIRERNDKYYLHYGPAIVRIPDWVMRGFTTPRKSVTVCPLLFYYGFEDTPMARELVSIMKHMYIPYTKLRRAKELLKLYQPFVRIDPYAWSMITTHLEEHKEEWNISIMEVLV